MHTIRNVSNWVIILFFVGFISGDVCGQTAQGSPRVESAAQTEEPLDARTLEQLKTIMTHLLETIYVSPETGNRLAGQLRKKFEAGGYKEATTRTQLATLLTRDLREWGNDKHLAVRNDPTSRGPETILDPEAWEKQKAAMSPPASGAA